MKEEKEEENGKGRGDKTERNWVQRQKLAFHIYHLPASGRLWVCEDCCFDCVCFFVYCNCVRLSVWKYDKQRVLHRELLSGRFINLIKTGEHSDFWGQGMAMYGSSEKIGNAWFPTDLVVFSLRLWTSRKKTTRTSFWECMSFKHVVISKRYIAKQALGFQ
jgi:hypothetical protein